MGELLAAFARNRDSRSRFRNFRSCRSSSLINFLSVGFVQKYLIKVDFIKVVLHFIS